METKYYTYANMWSCPRGAILGEHSSYNLAVASAIELTKSPAVEEAGVYVSETYSLKYRKLFSCEVSPYSFDPDHIDGDFVYSNPNGTTVHPPKEYYVLKKINSRFFFFNANSYKGIKIIPDVYL